MSSRQFLPRLGKSTSCRNGTVVVTEPLKIAGFSGDSEMRWMSMSSPWGLSVFRLTSPVTARWRVSVPVRVCTVALGPHSFTVIVVLCA